MRVLAVDEMEEVSAGLTSKEAGVMAATLGAGAAMAGSLALVPGPQQPAVAAVAATMAVAGALLGVYSAATA